MMPPYAVILAGGQGSRLGGVRKADLRIGGRTLLAQVSAALTPITGPLIVATGPQAAIVNLPPGSVAVADRADDHGGPLAGLAAAVEYLRRQNVASGILVSVAVDTPLIPHDYISRLIGALDGAQSAVAGWGAAFYPPNAAWRLEAIADLPEMIARQDGPKSPKALHSLVGGAIVDWQMTVNSDPFLNVNTVADLITLGRRIRR